MVKRILLVVAALVLVLVAVLVVKTLMFNPAPPATKAEAAPEVSAEALTHFQEAVRFKTISYDDSTRLDSVEFVGFRQFLEKTYPTVSAKLERELVAGYSMLYRWKGSNATLKPIVLMAHQDVVPIEEASRDKWTTEPFSGEVKDNFIWGRGTADNKINLISIFETVEKLLKENIQPERDVYFVFGHDEERGGFGARTIAALLKERGIHADMVLDEGGIVTREKVPFMTKPVALIGTAEKGYLNLRLTVNKSGGHSSMPDNETALDILMRALVKLRDHPFAADFTPATWGFVDHVGREMPWPQKIVFANTWLLKGVVVGIYESSPGGNALVRTTLVPTIAQAGVKANVIPSIAKATINLRLLQGDSSAKAIAYVKSVIDDDRVEVAWADKFVAEPSAVSAEDGFGYQRVQATVQKTFDNIIPTPFLMIGATDSRHFGDVSANIIKFSPMIDPIGFHGIDERVSIESYRQSLWFYEKLLRP